MKYGVEIEQTARALFGFSEGEAWGDIGDIEALKAAYIEDKRKKK